MEASSFPEQRRWCDLRNFLAVPLFSALCVVWVIAPGRGIDLANLDIWLAAVLPLVIAAIGQSQIVLVGGQGLAAGSTALLVNAIVSTQMSASAGSLIGWPLAGVFLSAAIGGCNGLLVGFLRLPSTAVTLATSFIVGGATLGFANIPSISPPHRLHALVATGIVPGLPTTVVMIAALLIVAAWLDVSALGEFFRNVGRGGWQAIDRRNGAGVALGYLIAGIGYGVSGVFTSAEFGLNDPASGGLSLLDIYAAVALGGSVPYLCQGSTLGAAIGALAIGGLTYSTALLGLPEYVAPASAAALLLAALWLARLGLPRTASIEPPAIAAVRFPIACFGLPLVIGILVIAGRVSVLLHIDPLVLAMAGVFAVANAGVVMTGHLDLSLPAISVFAGLACNAWSQGADAPLIWIIPLLLTIGLASGAANGFVALVLKAPRVIATLATTGLFNAASIAISIARPSGFAPPILMDFLTGGPTRPAPAALYLTAAALLGLTLWPLRSKLSRTTSFGAQLRGATLAHGLAGLLSAAAGVLLAGYGGHAPISGGDAFTLPSLLAIETAGMTVGRRGGDPRMLVLSVPMVLLADILMLGLGMKYAERVAAMGTLFLLSIVIRHLAPNVSGRPPGFAGVAVGV
jgi:ribose transport system permease protein